MKVKTTTVLVNMFKILLTLLLVSVFQLSQAQNPTYQCRLMNDAQTSPRQYEFDIYLLRTGDTQLELAAIQFGIFFNSSGMGAGTYSASFVGTSGLNSLQAPTAANLSIANSTPNKTIKITGNANPGSGNGTIISNVYPGTFVQRVRLTSTVDFTQNSLANLTWSFANPPSWPSKVTAYVAGLPVNITVQASHVYTLTNPPLNPPTSNPPAQYTMNLLGGPAYCEGTGLAITLSNSQAGVNYQLKKGGVDYGAVVPGTGAALSPAAWTGLTQGTYTAWGTADGTVATIAGTTQMAPTAGIVIGAPSPNVTPTFTQLGPYCQGATPGTLPTSSTNTPPITGTWNPTTISTTTPGVTPYVFTPTAGQCATTATMNVTVNANLPVSVLLNSSADEVCGATVVQFTAVPTNGGASPLYNWYADGILQTGHLPTFEYSSTNSFFDVYVMMTSDLACTSGNPATSLTKHIIVDPVLPVSVSLAADFTTVCAGTTVNFTATPTNGGSAPVYAWYKNTVLVPGVTGATYSYVPTNGDQVYVMLTSNETCTSGNPATSGTIALTVNPILPVSVSLAADFTTVCAGTTVNFTATPTNGGSAPVYAWYKNTVLVPGVTGNTYSYVPANGDQVYVELSSNETCMSGSPATSGTVTLTVNPILPVSVSLGADLTTVCAGTSVLFTAIPTNGGSAPVYAWYKNTVLVPGVTGNTYSYVPADGDQVYVMLTSNETCKSGSPATSGTITLTVNPLLPVSVSLASDFTTVCAGTTVNFTATPTNGGSAPVYAWYKNTVLVPGVTGSTYSYVPTNGDQVYVMLTSNETCKSGSPATSGTVTLTVNPLLPVSVSLAADFTTVCAGTTVNFIATPTNGGSSPLYAWYKNTVLVPGVTGNTYSYVPADGDQVYVMLTSNETCMSGSPATSGTVTLTVNPVLPVSVSLGADLTTVCDGTTVNFTATPTNGGSSPVYAWYVNTVLVPGVTGSTYSYVPADGDQVYVMLTSNETCMSGSPATSSTIALIVNPLLPVSVSLAADYTAPFICAGNSITLNATPTNGGSSPVYAWYKNTVLVPGVTGAAYTYVPANGDQIYVKLTSSETCTSGNPATSETITLNVSPILTASVSIAASANPVFPGTSVTFTATPVNGGTPSYQWYVNSIAVGSGLDTYTYVPLDGDDIYVVMTSTAFPCLTGSPATSNHVIMTVNVLLPVSVTIVADANPLCAGSSVTFTATPVNGGTPSYQWFENGNPVGTNQNMYTYVPLNGDQVYVVMTSSLTGVSGNPATSNTVIMTVNPVLTPSVSVVANANPVCEGTTVCFTATPVNGGPVPGYQWFVNGAPSGTNDPSYCYVPADGDEVYVVMTSSADCFTSNWATSNTVIMVVNQILTASVSIAANPSGNICAGTNVTFTATPVNGGLTPSYQWYVNGSPVGTNSATYAYAPANLDQVYVVMTSSRVCVLGSPATSNTITEHVNIILIAGVTISPNANNVCAGTTVCFTAVPENGGTTPSYQWYVNDAPAGTNDPSYCYVPADGDKVYVVMTSSEACITNNPATSNTVTMSVTQVLTASVSISANPSGNICAGTSVTFTAAPVNGGLTPSYQWYVNGSPVGTNSATYAYAPANLDQVYVVMTSSRLCVLGSPATSNTITEHVNMILIAGVTISPNLNNVCAGTTVCYTAVPENGGTTPSYQWYVNSAPAGTNNPSYCYVPADGDQVYVVMTSSETCITNNPATSNTVTMVVNPVLTLINSISTPQTTVCAGTSVTITCIHNYPVASCDWYLNGILVGHTMDLTYVPVNGDQVYCVCWTTPGGCWSAPSATSNVLTFMVNPLPGAIAGANRNICLGSSTTLGAAPVTGSTYSWTSVPAGFTSAIANPTVNPTVTTIYTVVETVTATQCTNSNSVTVTVNPIPVPTLNGPTPVCNLYSATYNTQTGMNNYQWTIPAGATITGGGNPTSGFVTLTWTTAGTKVLRVNYTTPGGCTGVAPAQLTVIVNPTPIPTITGTNTPCLNKPTVYSTVAFQTNYVWAVSGGATFSGQGTKSISVTWTTPGPQTVSLTYTGLNGCAAAAPTIKNVTVVTSCTKTNDNGGGVSAIDPIDSGKESVTIYPNPNDGTFTATMYVSDPDTYNLQVFSNLGVKVYELRDVQLSGTISKKIDLRNVSTGVYNFILSNKDKSIQKRIIIMK